MVVFIEITCSFQRFFISLHSVFNNNEDEQNSDCIGIC